MQPGEHLLQKAVTSFDMALGELNQLVHLTDLARVGEFVVLDRVTPSEEDQAQALLDKAVRGGMSLGIYKYSSRGIYKYSLSLVYIIWYCSKKNQSLLFHRMKHPLKLSKASWLYVYHDYCGAGQHICTRYYLYLILVLFTDREGFINSSGILI